MLSHPNRKSAVRMGHTFSCGSIPQREADASCFPMSQTRDMGHPFGCGWMGREARLPGRPALLAGGDAEGFHFAIEVAALEAEEFGGVADVVAGFFNLLEDVFALVGVAGLLQR